jgi:predicted NUDIX family phosphoesterase
MEQVFVVHRSGLFAGDWPQGFVPWSAGESDAMLLDLERRGFFVARAEAEQNPEWKQLIPYCMLRRGGQLFCVERRRAQGESRLHGLLSIGLGGHVNPGDEPDEELRIDWRRAAGPPELLGLLNDDSNPVGRVHAGLVFRLEFASTGSDPGTCDEATIRETSAMHGGFGHLAEPGGLWQDRARFESWSRILLEVGIAGPMAVSSGSHGARKGQESGREEPQHG